MYMDGSSGTCVMPYVSKIIVGEGIKNIGDGAFWGDTGLKNVILSNSVIGIDCNAFYDCTSLAKVKILSTGIGFGNTTFNNLVPNAKIYVLTSVTKARADASMNGTATVEVVTEEQMNSL